MDRKAGLALCIATLGVVLALFVLVTGVQEDTILALSQPTGRMSEVVTPTLLAVGPGRAPNNLDVTLTLTGTDFRAVLSGTAVLTAPAVRLDDVELPTVSWISSTSLTATVLWGLDAGVYTATVANPDGATARLTNAFTVEQAIGVWTTGGPYGGDVNDLAVSPLISTTAFAAVRSAGLFGTDDRGASWRAIVPTTGGIGGLAYTTVPTPQLYYWSEGQGLWHSGGSLVWRQINHRYYASLAVDPQDALHLWAGTNTGVSYSPDGGATWEERSNGLPASVFVQNLAVHPTNPSIVYAGTTDGRLYRTEDAGLSWQHLDNGLPAAVLSHGARALAIDPFDPDVVLYSRWMDQEAFGYRTTDGGESWSSIVAPDGCGLISDLAFSPDVPGTVYATVAAENPVGISTDGGATWQCIGQQVVDFMISLGLDPASGLPVYLGAHSAGTFRRAGDLTEWERATDGITGLPINGLAASPANPDTIYVAGEHAGAYCSNNAGWSWRQLSLGSVGAFGVAAHPTDADRAFFASDGGIYYNPDGRDQWLFSGMPVAYQTFLYSLAVAPTDPSIILAGGRDDTVFAENVGLAFLSDDGGAGWTQIDVGHPISYPADFAIDPTDSQTMYLSTDGWQRGVPGDKGIGLGVFQSTDGGNTWESVKNELGDYPVSALALRPNRPQTLFAGGVHPATWAGDVFRSMNAGDSWSPAGLPLDWGWVEDLAIDPMAPDTVFAGTSEGLFCSSDGGDTWERWSGEFGYLSILHLSIASDGERTVLYVGTPGGLPTTLPLAHLRSPTEHWDEYMQGGVYQLTIDHRPRPTIYLPLVVRNSRNG